MIGAQVLTPLIHTSLRHLFAAMAPSIKFEPVYYDEFRSIPDKQYSFKGKNPMATIREERSYNNALRESISDEGEDHGIQEKKEEEKRDEEDDGDSETVCLSNSSSNSSLDTMSSGNISTKSELFFFSNYEIIENLSLKRFHGVLSGLGIFVKKKTEKGSGIRYRRLHYVEDMIVISSVFSVKKIRLEDIKWCTSKGKYLTLDTLHHGKITLKIPKLTDAIAFKNVLG